MHSAYRARYSSQHVLLRLIEGWRHCLDENKMAEAILMDLSKAFDCLLHDLLIAKLEVCGIEKRSLLSLLSYLHQRKQSVKVKELSGLLQLIKSGVPQWSKLGSILFNIFINDIYFSYQEDLHNFADDNTVSAMPDSLQALLEVLTEKANTAIDWFQLNDMILNSGKFKAILLQKNKRNTSEYPIVLRGHEIQTREPVTLLGVTIDYKLSFEEHVANLCQKASAQLNVLKRLGTFMSHQTRKSMVQSFILAQFNYCSLVWYFTSAKQTNKMEKIQERALRFITDDYSSSYEKLPKDSNTSKEYILFAQKYLKL